MVRVISKGKNLAGTCGIPSMEERVRVKVAYEIDPEGVDPSRARSPCRTATRGRCSESYRGRSSAAPSSATSSSASRLACVAAP